MNHNRVPASISLIEMLKITEDDVERLLLREYGAVFAAVGVVVPPCVIFPDTESVEAFQASVDRREVEVGGLRFTLQSAAAESLLRSVDDAAELGLTLGHRGSDSGNRSFGQTVALWSSRVEPALSHWTASGRIDVRDAERIRAEPLRAQIASVLAFEHEGIYFSKDFRKSIIYSVAPPGASQHLSLLAFDVAEFANEEIRKILAHHGWFQTVTSDLPHFTYLGLDEADLERANLKKVTNAGQDFWIPDVRE